MERARSAGAAARRTSEGEVDVMTAMLETKERSESRTRQRRALTAGAAAAAVAAVVVAAVMLTADDPSSSPQPTEPEPTVSIPSAPQVYGAGMPVPIALSAPDGWQVSVDPADDAVGFLAPPSSGGGVQQVVVIGINQPADVKEYTNDTFIPTPDDYAGWLRAHPFFRTVSETAVTVDGRPGTQLELELLPMDDVHQLIFGNAAGFSESTVYSPGNRLTITVVDVGEQQLVVQGGGITSDSEFKPAYDAVLADIRILG
jgi:hypothetical protein